MKTFFKELFEYNHHCNQELGKAFNNHAGIITERAQQLFSHILDAHQIWNNRIEPWETPFGVWQVHPIKDFINLDKINHKHSLLILDQYGFDKTIDYISSKGQRFSSSVQNILFHVINHSTYHRAQIATEFRESGIDPLVTDYIVYKR